MSEKLTDATEQWDPEKDPFACSLCGGPLSELEHVAEVDICDDCRTEVCR